jgi:hypothetical protein
MYARCDQYHSFAGVVDVAHTDHGTPLRCSHLGRYVFRSRIGMEQEEFKNSTILVVQAEPKDASLRDFINNKVSSPSMPTH